VRSGKSGDVAAMAGSKQPRSANSLFRNILRVSRLSAIFCRVERISESGKSGRIKNLAALAQKNHLI